jgi:PAS domain S-box-containing protein
VGAENDRSDRQPTQPTQPDLQESEQFLRSVYDNIEASIFVVDVLENGEFRYAGVNPANERLTGFSYQEAYHNTPDQVLLPTEAEIVKRHYQACVEVGEKITYEEFLVMKGRETWWITTLTPLRDHTSRIYRLVGSSIDISDRKRAEAALQQREHYFRTLTENASDIIVLLDAKGNFLYVSPSSERILGYVSTDVVGKNLVEFVPSEDVPIIMQVLMDAVQNPHVSQPLVECRIRAHNGNLQTVEAITTSLLDDPIVQGVVVNCRDISDRKVAQDALRKSEERFRSLSTCSPIGIYTVDPDGYGTWSNPRLQELAGFSLEESLGKGWSQFIHPEDLEHFQDLWQEYYQTGRSFDGEYRFQHPNGTLKWVREISAPMYDDVGNLIGHVGAIEDITARKQAEAAIQQLNAQLEQQNRELEAMVAQRTAELLTFINALPDFIFVVDREMRLVFSNDANAQLNFGMKNGRAVQGKTLFDCFPPEQANYFAEQNRQVFESGETLHIQQSYRLQNREIYVDTYKIPLKHADGQVYALIGSSRNITELVEARQELTDRTLQLEATNRELDSFCYSVSHDLRAPLRHISGFVSALRRELENLQVISSVTASENSSINPQINRYLRIIEESSIKMGQLIDGLLTLSRMGRRKMQVHPVNLPQLVDTAIALVIGVEEATSIEWTIGNLPTVLGDATLLQQVFSNLIENAVKFSRDRHPIQIEIGALADDTIFIRDNGVGFSMEYVDQLFGAFQRLHAAREFAGNGIGLAIVKRIIHRHGGTIWAESQPNQGATFYFTLGHPEAS